MHSETHCDTKDRRENENESDRRKFSSLNCFSTLKWILFHVSGYRLHALLHRKITFLITHNTSNILSSLRAIRNVANSFVIYRMNVLIDMPTIHTRLMEHPKPICERERTNTDKDAIIENLFSLYQKFVKFICYVSQVR